MRKINNSVFVVLSTKGGAGKTTGATQLIIPFLTEMRGVGKSLPRLYEVDYKNNGSQGLSESKIFAVTLVTGKELEDVIVRESSNFMRDYPIIFDIGVSEFEKAFSAFSGKVFDEGVLYILPTKTSETDFKNTADSIRLIRSADPTAEFIVVCSDAKHGHNEESFLRDEFGMIFGTWLDPTTKKPFPSLFKSVNITERFIALKSSELFDKTITSYRTTLYEAAKEGLAIKAFLSSKDATEPHAIDSAIAAVKAKGLKEKDPKKLEELLAESEFLTKTRKHYINCATYYETYLAPSFRDFAKLIG